MPDLLFRGSYFLDVVGFRDMYSEKGLGTAILREMKSLFWRLGLAYGTSFRSMTNWMRSRMKNI